MEKFSVSLALCAGNSMVTGEFLSQRPVTRSFDDFFDLRLNKRLSKQSRREGFETPSRSLWRHCNDMTRNRWIEERGWCQINGHLFSREPVVSIDKQENVSQIAKFMGPTWGPPGSCRPQMGPMLAPWTLLSGMWCKWLWLLCVFPRVDSLTVIAVIGVGEVFTQEYWCRNNIPLNVLLYRVVRMTQWRPHRIQASLYSTTHT